MSTTWIVDLKKCPDNPDELYFDIPIEVMEQMGLKIGDQFDVTSSTDSVEFKLIRK